MSRNDSTINWVELDGKEVIRTRVLKDIVLMNYKRLVPGLKYYRVVCPRCLDRNIKKGEFGYNKKNLSILKDFSYGRCFRCSAIFIDSEFYLNKEIEFDSEDDFEFYDNDFSLTKCSSLSIVDSFTDLHMSIDGLDYMTDRNSLFNINTKQYKLKYKLGKLLIPYYFIDQSLIYYQFRYTDLKYSPNGAKYHNPPIDNKPLYIPQNSNGLVEWDASRPIILVEGALTAIALKMTVGDDYNVAAVVGNTITSYQIKMLKYLSFIDIYVFMDSYDFSLATAEVLAANKIRSTIIPSSGPDSEELLNEMGYHRFKNYVLSNISTTAFEFMTWNIENTQIDNSNLALALDFKL